MSNKISKVTLREHHAIHGSHARGAQDLGVSANMYHLWLCGKSKPSWKSILILISKGILVESFPD